MNRRSRGAKVDEMVVTSMRIQETYSTEETQRNLQGIMGVEICLNISSFKQVNIIGPKNRDGLEETF